ncbi:MAG: hypothetical protein GWN13_00235 [Phycisphaerae bacterium]|nr:hypothetical protein [Phycisphaerae bacterium]
MMKSFSFLWIDLSIKVLFNPEADPAIMTRQPNGSVKPEKGRPAYIGLGHELIHALREVLGSMEKEEETRYFIGPRGERRRETAEREEFETVGLPGFEWDITENDLRREHGRKERGAYGYGEEVDQ